MTGEIKYWSEKGPFSGDPADYNEFENNCKIMERGNGATVVADHGLHNSGVGAAYVAPAAGAAFIAEAQMNANYAGLAANGGQGGNRGKADKMYKELMQQLSDSAKIVATGAGVNNYFVARLRLRNAYGVNNAAARRGATNGLLQDPPPSDIRGSNRAHFHSKDHILDVQLGGNLPLEEIRQHAYIASLDDHWKAKATEILARENAQPIAAQNETLKTELSHMQEAEEIEEAREDKPAGAKLKAKVKKANAKTRVQEPPARGPNYQKNQQRKAAKKARVAAVVAKAAMVDVAMQNSAAGGPLMLPVGAGGGAGAGLMAPVPQQMFHGFVPQGAQVAAYGAAGTYGAQPPQQPMKGKGKGQLWCDSHHWCNHVTADCKGKGKSGKKGKGKQGGKGKDGKGW
jgi:hypothetical protein